MYYPLLYRLRIYVQTILITSSTSLSSDRLQSWKKRVWSELTALLILKSYTAVAIVLFAALAASVLMGPRRLI